MINCFPLKYILKGIVLIVIQAPVGIGKAVELIKNNSIYWWDKSPISSPKYSLRRHVSFGDHTYLALSDFLQFVSSLLCQTLRYILQRVQNHHIIESNSRVHCSRSWHTKDRPIDDRLKSYHKSCQSIYSKYAQLKISSYEEEQQPKMLDINIDSFANEYSYQHSGLVLGSILINTEGKYKATNYLGDTTASFTILTWVAASISRHIYMYKVM